MRLLAFDTSGPHCAAVLLAGQAALAEAHEPMARGQGERLMPMLEALLEQAGHTWSDLTALAVGVGPGNFTGIRLGVSAARGLALALDVPALPMSSFELARDLTAPEDIETELVLVAAPREAAYAQTFRYGRPKGPASLIDPADPPQALRAENIMVTGHRAAEAAKALGASVSQANDSLSLTGQMAKLATWKWTNGHDLDQAPVPLYVRAADAAPPADAPPRVVP